MKPSKKTAAEKTCIYQRITDLIVAKIESGVAPWRKPQIIVQVNGRQYGCAVNVLTGKPYEGINTLVLGCSPYDLPVFGTFKQIQSLGGTVRKGAKSLPVVFWKKTTPKPDNEGEQQDKGGFILHYYNVFNVLETDLDASVFRVGTPPAPELLPETQKIPACEQIVAGFKNGPLLVHRDQKRMCYSPALDVVNMPDQARFKQPREYYYTLFHELVHATGHSTRLARFEDSAGFGSEKYSKEELVAELGAAFLSSVAGLESEDTLENSASYLKGWLRPLKEDKRFIFQASGHAKKAVRLILGEPPAQQAA